MQGNVQKYPSPPGPLAPSANGLSQNKKKANEQSDPRARTKCPAPAIRTLDVFPVRRETRSSLAPGSPNLHANISIKERSRYKLAVGQLTLARRDARERPSAEGYGGLAPAACPISASWSSPPRTRALPAVEASRAAPHHLARGRARA
jgi:hypothetical protein